MSPVQLLLPVPVVVLATSVAGLALAGTAVIAAPTSEPHPLLTALVAGLGFALPFVVLLLAERRGKRQEERARMAEMEKRDAEHTANTRKLERILEVVEGDEGLIADRKRNRDRRHAHGNILQALTIRVRFLERHAQRTSGYEPPAIEEIPHRRHSDPRGHQGEP